MNEFIAWELNADIPGDEDRPQSLPRPRIQVHGVPDLPRGVLKVRNDLVHLSDLGASISGYVIAAAIAHEWT